MSHLFESVDDYALSKDVDVALWLDCRAFNKKEPLRDALDFVIVNTRLHDDFDEFKRNEIQSGYSYLQMNELLQYYIDHGCGHLKQHIITRYGLTYLKLDGDQIDHLCRWIKVKRDCIRQDYLHFNLFTTMQQIQTFMMRTALLLCTQLQKLLKHHPH